MSPITIENYPGLMNTPALKLAVRAWDYLLRFDLCDPGAIVVQYDHKAIVASVEGVPVGVLTWIDNAWANQLNIAVAWVEEDHRRQGVHTRMWLELIREAQKLKRPVIQSSTALNNMAARAAMQCQGRTTTSINVAYVVPPEDG